MSRIVKVGIIQMANKLNTDASVEEHRTAMIEAHIPYMTEAAKQGVQMLCFQEIFTGPYFCPSQDTKWYHAAEPIPEGPTTQLMCEYARKHKMVIIVPIYEEHITGIHYNTAAVIDADGKYLGKYRKNHIPQVAGFWENSLSADGEFHVQLLKRMLLSIEGVRPALLSEGSYKFLNELRGFRHVFRHAYNYGLDAERVSTLLRKILAQKGPVSKDLNNFRKIIAGYIEL